MAASGNSGFQSTIVLVLSIIALTISVVSVPILIYNLNLLNLYQERSFFKQRSIKFLIFTIISSTIEVFILIPISVLSVGLSVIECTNFALNLQLLFHTTLVNLWITSLFMRLWHVFVRVRKYQDSLEWKQVCLSIFFFFFHSVIRLFSEPLYD